MAEFANAARLGLGTVQFGLDYGISNKSGRTSVEEAGRILSRAYEAGVRVVDTAADYGVSEETLGAALCAAPGWRVVTKTTTKGRGPADAEASLRRSLERLRRGSVYGLLVHHAEGLLGPGGEAVYAELRRLKAAGLATRIGVSVYTGEQIDAILARYEIDLIQVPVNVLDQRLLAGGQLRRSKERGVEVHARSVFLQGALLMAPETLPSPLHAARGHLRNYHEEVRRLGLTPLEAALGFVLSIREIDVAVCGVESLAQLEDILTAARRSADFGALAPFSLDDEKIVNPALWAR